jgi:ribosomal protein L9
MLKTIVVKNTGKNKYTPGTVVEFSRGYARYLIKQGKVLYATEKNQIVAEKLLTEEKKKRAEKIKIAEILEEKLKKEKISFISSQYNGNGILFGAIKIVDIVNSLHKLSKDYYNIKNGDVSLNKVIKTHGIYLLTIFLYEREVKIPVIVGKSEQDIKTLMEEYRNMEKVTLKSEQKQEENKNE